MSERHSVLDGSGSMGEAHLGASRDPSGHAKIVPAGEGRAAFADDRIVAIVQPEDGEDISAPLPWRLIAEPAQLAVVPTR